MRIRSNLEKADEEVATIVIDLGTSDVAIFAGVCGRETVEPDSGELEEADRALGDYQALESYVWIMDGTRNSVLALQ